MTRYYWYNPSSKPKKPYTRSPEIQAKYALAREEAQEKLRHNAKPIYEYIRTNCNKIMVEAASDPTLQFFLRQGKWWLRIQIRHLCAKSSDLYESQASAALKWLIKEGYVLENNFDKDYCSIKWYAISEKPFIDTEH